VTGNENGGFREDEQKEETIIHFTKGFGGDGSVVPGPEISLAGLIDLQILDAIPGSGMVSREPCQVYLGSVPR